MKTASCKAKGRELQKHCAKKIKEVFGLHEDDVVSRPMGSPGQDLMLSPLAQTLLPLSIECKNTKTFPSLAALEQAKYNAKPSETPCVMWKPPGKSMNCTIVYLNLEDFLILMKSEKGKNNV